MTKIGNVIALASALTAGLLLPVPPASAQQGGRAGAASPNAACPMVREFAEFHKCALEKMKNFTPPRTPDGKPDFNGMWGPTRSAQDIEEIKTGQYGNFAASKSLIVDPPTGRIPYQPWAMKHRIQNEKIYISPTAACLPVGVQRWVYSPVSVTGHRIIQQPNQIITSMERLHTYRIIPLGNAPRRLDPKIKLWNGISQGRWDGDTLVIETTNIQDKVWFDHIGTFVSQAVKMTERLTYVDQNTLHYEETIEDPQVFTQPWKIAIALLRSPAKGMDRMDLEDTTVEYCDNEIHHFFTLGQRLWRGYATVAPK
jgi:hypothetical protein